MPDTQTEKIIITQGHYITSAVKKEQYPETGLPEVVFMGRSNVGKSSLINSLTRMKGLARVSSQPGKTQTINFYELGAKLAGEEQRRSFYLVDLPGYGYARTGREKRKIWSKFIEEYLLTSRNLVFVCQLIDIRHEPQKKDLEFMEFLGENCVPFAIVFTKADKISKQTIQKQTKSYLSHLKNQWEELPPYFVTSATTTLGRDDILSYIESVNNQIKEQ